MDAIFKAAALAANGQRIPLAKLAVEETGMGVLEDKVIKVQFASEVRDARASVAASALAPSERRPARSPLGAGAHARGGGPAST